MTLHISSRFDAGNIDVIAADDPADIRLAIRRDAHSDFYQWFHFRVQGARQQPLRLRLTNAAGAAYPDGWDGYQALASHDRQHWFRVPTRYLDGELVIEHTPATDSVYYAYFAPYSFERHLDLIARCQQSPRCRVETLGRTLDGHDLDLLRFGDPAEGKRTLWLIARQHPGETMAEWLMEGVLERLCDPDDALAGQLLEQAVLYLVPNMNPDGSVRGHLRTNAAGANLNREWHSPSAERSPEVLKVRQRMLATGVDLFLDIHGDEALPYNFVAGCEGNPGYSPRLATLETQFKDALMRINPDFQDRYGYPKDAPGAADPSLATHWVGQQFDCLAFTLEMPFKDNADRPDPQYGWSPARSARLGRSLLDAIAAVMADLR